MVSFYLLLELPHFVHFLFTLDARTLKGMASAID